MVLEYSREIVNGGYNIDNPLRIDGEGKQIRLAKELEEVIECGFKVRCKESSCKIITDEEVSNIEEITGVVNAHKNNT